MPDVDYTEEIEIARETLRDQAFGARENSKEADLFFLGSALMSITGRQITRS